MKPFQVLPAFALALLVAATATATIAAQTEVSTFDDGDRAQLAANGLAVFAIDATIHIENEQGGGWLPNKTYQVNWTLRLDSVTPQFLNGSNFYIVFSWPALNNLTPTIPAEVIVNQTQLSLAHKTGTISAVFTPTNASDGFYMNPDFPYRVYVDGKAEKQDWASGVWYGEGGISTNVISDEATQQPGTPKPLTSLQWVTLIVAALVMLLTLAVLTIRKQNTSRKNVQVHN